MLIGQLGFWLMAAASAYIGVTQLGTSSGAWIVFALSCVGSAVLGAAQRVVKAIEKASAE